MTTDIKITENIILKFIENVKSNVLFTLAGKAWERERHDFSLKKKRIKLFKQETRLLTYLHDPPPSITIMHTKARVETHRWMHVYMYVQG